MTGGFSVRGVRPLTFWAMTGGVSIRAVRVRVREKQPRTPIGVRGQSSCQRSGADHIVAEVYGSSDMKRARLIAWATWSWCWAERPVRLRE